jgi:hypothetical protein
MLPFLLAAVGGYLIGDAFSIPKFADGGEIGDEITIETADYNQYTGKIVRVSNAEMILNFGNDIKGKESTTYYTIIDKDGKERSGLQVT